MAVTTKDVRVRLVIDSSDVEADTKALAKNIEDVSKKSGGVDGLTGSFTKLGAGIIVVNQALELARSAFTLMAGPIQAATQAFIEQDKAEQRLVNTLKIFDQYSVEAMANFNEFASELQRASTIGDEAALEMIATAKAMDLTNEQAKQLTQTAADLAEATGVDAKTAFDQLRGTLGGVVRELGKYFPELKSLTEEQLKAGAAIEVLGQKFAGMAQAGTMTLAGSLTQLANAFGDLMEEVGRFLVEFLNIPGAIRAVTTALNFMTEIIKSINDLLARLGFVGDIIKHTAAIAALVLAYTALNMIIMSTTAAQSGLTTGFAAVGAAVGAQTLAVTSLSAAFVNFQRIAVATVATGFRGLIVVIGQATRSVITLTSAVVFNPLFLKAAALAVGLAAFAKAIQEVFQEVSFLSEAVRNFGAIFSKTLGEMTESLNFFNNLREAALVTFNVIKEVAKILIVGFLGSIVLAIRGVVALMQAFSLLRGETDKYNETVLKLENAMKELGAAIDKSLTNLTDPVGKLSGNLENVEKSANRVGSAFAGVNRQLRNTFDFDLNNLRDRIFGDEFTQAALDYKKALIDLQITRQNIMRDEKNSVDLVERYREAALEHNRARFTAEKLIADTISGLRQTQIDQTKEMLRDQEKHVELAKYEARERTQALEQTIVKVRGLADVIKVPIGGFNDLRESLAKYNNEQLQLAQSKELQRKLEADKKAAEELAKEFDAARTAVDKILADIKDLKSQLENIGVDPNTAIELERINNVLRALENQDLLIKAKLDPAAARQLTDSMIRVSNQIAAKKVELQFFSDLEDTGIIASFAGKFAYATALAVNEQLLHVAEDKGIADALARTFGLAMDIKPIDKKALQEFILAAAKFTSALIDGIIFAAVVFVGILNGAFIDTASDIIEGIGEIPNKLLDSFNRLDQVLINFVNKFFNATIQLVQKLPGLITNSIVPMFSQFIITLSKAMPHIVNALAQAAPEVLAALLEGIGILAEKLPDALLPLIMKLPEIIASILAKLPEIILKVLVSLGQIIAMLVRQVPQIIVEIFTYLPDIISAVIEGLVASAGDVALAIIDAFVFRGGIEKIAAAFLRFIPKFVWAVVDGLAKGLKRVAMNIGQIWKGHTKIIDGLQGIADKAESAITQIARKISKETSQVFQIKDLEEAAKGGGFGEQISKAFQTGIDALVYHTKGLFQKLKEFWLWLFNGIKNAFIFLYETFFKPLLDAITFIITTVGEFLKTAIEMAAELLKAAWMFIYEKILMPVIDGLTAVFLWFYDKVITPFITAVGDLAKAVGDFLSKIGQAVKDIALALSDFAKNVGKQLTDALKLGLDGLKTTFNKVGTWIADGLKTALNGLGDFLTDIFQKIDPANLFEKIFKVDYQGMGTVEKALNIDMPFANFAAGGLVPGSAMVGGDSLLNDRILALLSPGEAVIPRSAMQEPGIAALVRAIMQGKVEVPQFALGGTLGGIVNAAQDVGGQLSAVGKDLLSSLGLSLDAAWDMVRKEVFGMVMKMFEANGFAQGGIVPGNGFGDSVPAMLTPGEFVVRRQSARHNFDTLSQINQVGSAGSGGVVISKIEINAKTNLDADSIRREVIPAMEKHLKRASLDGKPLIANSGVFTR